jgi:cytosine/uracil/thiamine/allantoin permease
MLCFVYFIRYVAISYIHSQLASYLQLFGVPICPILYIFLNFKTASTSYKIFQIEKGDITDIILKYSTVSVACFTCSIYCIFLIATSNLDPVFLAIYLLFSIIFSLVTIRTEKILSNLLKVEKYQAS